MNVPKIGMRNIKTSVSVFICLLIFEIVNRDNSFYACIAAIICMQTTLENSFKIGITRTMGTLLGGLFGAIILSIGGSYISDKAFIFLIPLSIMLLIELCVSLNRKEAVAISCIVFLSIVISHRARGDYLSHTINRIIDTIIGIIVAVAVNKYLKMPDSLKKYTNIHKKTDDTDDIEEDLN
jgi:uncharacterized membrane protein YgaE (UPF0421/DUF939 family)